MSASSEGLLVYKRDTCHSMVSECDGKGSLFYYSETFAPYRLHPTEKKGEHGYDILYKVRPLIDHLAAVFTKYYRPGRNASIDEMMIGTRCRIAFLQYIPKKTN